MVVTDFARRAVPWVTLMTERARSRDAQPRRARARERRRGARRRRRAARRAPIRCLGGGGDRVALNADLYQGGRAELGTRGVLAAVPLHAIHQLVGVAAVPAALVRRRAR